MMVWTASSNPGSQSFLKVKRALVLGGHLFEQAESSEKEFTIELENFEHFDKQVLSDDILHAYSRRLFFALFEEVGELSPRLLCQRRLLLLHQPQPVDAHFELHCLSARCIIRVLRFSFLNRACSAEEGAITTSG